MREMRSLGFTDREVITAVLDLMRKTRQPLPSGQIRDISFYSDPVRAELLIEDDFGEKTTVHRNAAELAASLVNYCLERRIRLPSHGRKFVELIAGSLNVVVDLENAAPAPRSRRPAGRAAARG